MRFVIFYIFILSSFNISAQTGHILVISNTPSKVIVDGTELGILDANKPVKFEVAAGEHYLQVIMLDSEEEKNEIIVVENGVQKVIRYKFEQAQTLPEMSIFDPIELANLSINIPGGFTSAIGDYETSGVPIFYYHFLKNDQVIIDFDMSNKNGRNSIEVVSYPDNNRIYSNSGFQNLQRSIIKIPAAGIYRISFATNHVFDRTGQLVINRIPSSEETLNHETKVVLKRKYEVVTIQEPSDQWVNSETSLTGTTQIVIPVNLPPNTIEWYYIISASRTKENIESNLKNTSLVKDLSKGLMEVNPATMALNIGLDLISQPPGSDYCDVYLVDFNSYQSFLANVEFMQYPEGTRTNITSAKVKVSGITEGQYYLGIRNNNLYYGINVGVEVAAIVYEDYYERDK